MQSLTQLQPCISMNALTDQAILHRTLHDGGSNTQMQRKSFLKDQTNPDKLWDANLTYEICPLHLWSNLLLLKAEEDPSPAFLSPSLKAADPNHSSALRRKETFKKSAKPPNLDHPLRRKNWSDPQANHPPDDSLVSSVICHLHLIHTASQGMP